ncbi:MAG TPA: radical SAM protein [Anaerolineaceae bacterium]
MKLNWRSFFSRDSTLRIPDAGVYAFQFQDGGEKVRVHLRMDTDGYGVLLVNAARIYHLNPSAALMAYFHLSGVSEEKIVVSLTKLFDVPADQFRSDYREFTRQFTALIEPNGACPIHDLGLSTVAPFSQQPNAPYRMDLAITYRCNNDCSHCYNARSRLQPELPTRDWKKIIDRLWQIGIPHIVFTGGEPTLRPDLIEMIGYAQNKGMVAGLNTNGRKLKDLEFTKALVQAGLDHVQITLESADPAIHDLMVGANGAWEDTVQGIQNVLVTPLYMMTNTTLLTTNQHTLTSTLEFLASCGVPTVGLNALIYSGKGASVGTGIPEDALPRLLETASAITRQNHQRLIWYTPTQYCRFDPMMLDLGIKGCTAALYNMCIEPDGSVIPCQSYYQSLGRLLETPWKNIWEHPLARALRLRENLPEGCKECAFVNECGGGCPLSRKAIQPHIAPFSHQSSPEKEFTR